MGIGPLPGPFVPVTPGPIPVAGTPGVGGSVVVLPRPLTTGIQTIAVGGTGSPSSITFSSGTPQIAPGAGRPEPSSFTNNYRTGSNQNYSGSLPVGGGSGGANTGTGGGGGSPPAGAGGVGGSGIVVIRVPRLDVH